MLIDFHTHTQPSAEAAKEFYTWGSFKDSPFAGTPEEAIALMDEAGVAAMLIVPWFPAQDLVAQKVAAGEARKDAVREVVERWKALNGWAAETTRRFPGRFYSLVGLDPFLMEDREMEDEVALRLSQGACGLKIAPMFLNAPPSDPRVEIVWKLADKHGVFILSEASGKTSHPRTPHGHPAGFESRLKAYPNVKVQMAHLGRGAEDELARLTAAYPNVYADLSLRMHAMGQPPHFTAEELVAAIRKVGVDRVIYGTNYPLVDIGVCAEAFADLPLTDAEREMISSRNVMRLLGKA